MGLLVGLPLKIFMLLVTLIRLALPVLVVVGVILLLRAMARRRGGSRTGYRENKAKEPEFDGPVYTVDYEEVDEDDK